MAVSSSDNMSGLNRRVFRPIHHRWCTNSSGSAQVRFRSSVAEEIGLGGYSPPETSDKYEAGPSVWGLIITNNPANGIGNLSSTATVWLYRIVDSHYVSTYLIPIQENRYIYVHRFPRELQIQPLSVLYFQFRYFQ